MFPLRGQKETVYQCPRWPTGTRRRPAIPVLQLVVRRGHSGTLAWTDTMENPIGLSFRFLLPEQRQNRLRYGVRLCQRRHRGLL